MQYWVHWCCHQYWGDCSKLCDTRVNQGCTGDITAYKMVLGGQGLLEMSHIQLGAATREDWLPAWQVTIGSLGQMAGDWMGGTIPEEIGAVHIWYQLFLPPNFMDIKKWVKLSVMSCRQLERDIGDNLGNPMDNGPRGLAQPESKTRRTNLILLLHVFLPCDN